MSQKDIEEEARERRQRIIAQNGPSGIHYYKDSGIYVTNSSNISIKEPNKYKVKCKGVEIDVYDVLTAFNVTNPAIQHAIKKLLKGGTRGYKDEKQDYTESIEAINRGIELIK